MGGLLFKIIIKLVFQMFSKLHSLNAVVLRLILKQFSSIVVLMLIFFKTGVSECGSKVTFKTAFCKSMALSFLSSIWLHDKPKWDSSIDESSIFVNGQGFLVDMDPKNNSSLNSKRYRKYTIRLVVYIC